MSNTPLKIKNAAVQSVVFVFIVGAYLHFAPNYQWTEESLDTAYGADFLQEWVGARMLVTGHADQLYDVEVFREWQYDRTIVGFDWQTDQYFPPVYPPPHYALFSPLACLPYRWAVVVWLMVLVAAALGSAKLLAQIVEHHARVSRNPRLEAIRAASGYLWIGLLLFPSLLFSITLGQKSVGWLLVACMTWRLLQCNRDFVAGMTFGLLSIKPTLFFLFPLVMLRHRRWSFFVGASATVVAIWGTTACIVPTSLWWEFAQGLRTVGSYAENPGYRLDWSCNLMTMAYGMPSELTTWCKWVICLPLSLYLLYCIFEDKAFAVASPEKALMLFAVTLLVSPHTYHYDMCVLLLPILWLACTDSKRGLAYYAMLSVGVVMAGDMQEYLHIPLVPVLLIGIVAELRLRVAMARLNPTDCIVSGKAQALPVSIIISKSPGEEAKETLRFI